MEIERQCGDLHDIHVLEPPKTEEKTLTQRAISRTFKSTAVLANRLPTGSVLIFQLLSSLVTNHGCCNLVGRFMTVGLVTLCGLSCFVLSFTDSIRDENGNVCYGVAMFRGFWAINRQTTLSPEIVVNYHQLRLIDFMHAFMSILVFGAMVVSDKNVVSCFYPTPSVVTHEILTGVPAGIGVVCSVLFVLFPTNRHSLGFVLSED